MWHDDNDYDGPEPYENDLEELGRREAFEDAQADRDSELDLLRTLQGEISHCGDVGDGCDAESYCSCLCDPCQHAETLPTADEVQHADCRKPCSYDCPGFDGRDPEEA